MTQAQQSFVERRTASSPHIAYSYRDVPGAPTVVLLHSLAMDRSMWVEVSELLGDDVSVVLIDTRGHGNSDRTGTVTPADWVQDILRVLDELDIPRATLVGVSMGGMQALAFAGSHPTRTSGIVVADSYMVLPAEIAQNRIAAQAELASRLPMPRVADEYVQATLLDTTSGGADLVRDVIGRMTAEDYVAAVTSCFSADVSAAIPSVTAPALVLWGEQDQKTPRPLSETIAAALPNGTLATIPRAGHLSNVDEPEQFTDAVTGFLRSLDLLPR